MWLETCFRERLFPVRTLIYRAISSFRPWKGQRGYFRGIIERILFDEVQTKCKATHHTSFLHRKEWFFFGHMVDKETELPQRHLRCPWTKYRRRLPSRATLIFGVFVLSNFALHRLRWYLTASLLWNWGILLFYGIWHYQAVICFCTAFALFLLHGWSPTGSASRNILRHKEVLLVQVIVVLIRKKVLWRIPWNDQWLGCPASKVSFGWRFAKSYPPGEHAPELWRRLEGFSSAGRCSSVSAVVGPVSAAVFIRKAWTISRTTKVRHCIVWFVLDRL